MIMIQLERAVTFDLLEGSFKAVLTQAKTFTKLSSKGKQNWIRLTFEVEVEGMENFECRAGRNFQLSLKAGSDLFNFLGSILGPEFFNVNSAKAIDLEKVLVGKTGVVLLRHFLGRENTKPFVVVESFEPEILPTTDASDQPKEESK